MPNPRLSLIAILPVLICFSCQETPSAGRPLGDLLAPATAPKTFTDYTAIAPLFEQNNDTTYLINLWATWCKPCLEELPLLQQVADENRDEPLKIILLSLDRKPEDVARVPLFLERAKVNLPTLILATDDEEWGLAVDQHWTGALPTSVLYQGNRRYVYRRAFNTLPDLRAALSPLLGH